tara:strand:+ start:22 stop:450 length:429 start_codon:yes stop_codon:yes gene_type:complete
MRYKEYNVNSVLEKSIKLFWENGFRGTSLNEIVKVTGVNRFSLHDELITMNNAGMSNSQILQSATALPAKWLGSNTGKIMQEKKANLVLLEANPLIDIANTRRVHTVLMNGRILDRILLDQMLESVKKADNSSRKKEISQYE